MCSPHKAARIRRIAGAVYCRAMLDQHCMITWASGGQACFTPALWVKHQDYWEGCCQEGREDCSLAHSRVRAAKCWPCCRVLLRSPCSGHFVQQSCHLASSCLSLRDKEGLPRRKNAASICDCGPFSHCHPYIFCIFFQKPSNFLFH